MASAALGIESRGILRSSRWDAWFVALATLHGIVLLAWPALPVIAIGVWWNSNTISHNFIHRPFFRSRFLNRIFSAYLSVLLGVPQALWRERHLAHHAGRTWRLRVSTPLVVETILVISSWTVLARFNARFFAGIYLPGYLIGLALCAVQGHYEHVRGATSHYGSIYNLLCFNDGYHVEHHANPGLHWTSLPKCIEPRTHTSRWPPLMRWLDHLNLEGLELLVLKSGRLQKFILRSHLRAFRELLLPLPPIRRAVIVGGGLFPRSALILQDLAPGVEIVIIERNSRNLETARPFVGGSVEFINQEYAPDERPPCDLLVIPLAFDGDRARIYQYPPARAVLVHDWIWRRRGTGRIVSRVLLKRLNLVTQCGP